MVAFSRLALVVGLALWLLGAPEANAGPCRAKYGCHEHLHKAPMPQDRPVGRYLSSRGMPAGPRAAARRGDYYIRSRTMLAVVRAADGALVDLALGPHFTDRIGWGKVRVCDSEGTHDVSVRRFVLQRDALVVVGAAAGGTFEVETQYKIVAETGLEITTSITNSSSQTRHRVRVCDHFGLANTPLYVSNHGEVHPSQGVRRLRTAFCIRSAVGSQGSVSYLLTPLDTGSMGLRIGWGEPRGAFDPAIDADYRWRPIPPRKRVLAARRLLVASRGPEFRVLAQMLAARRVRTQTLQLGHGLIVPGTRLVVERGGRPYLETLLLGWQTTAGPEQRQVRLKLPATGRYRLRLWVPGVGDGPWLELTKRRSKLVVIPQLPLMGRVRFEVREQIPKVRAQKAPLLPAKLVFAGIRGTPSPDFGRGGVGLRGDNVIYTHGEGEVWLAPGRYRVQISAGFRRDVSSARLVVGDKRTCWLRQNLQQVISAPGWIGADLHVHGNASFDSPLPPTTRLISAAATATELFVAADHNAITDYGAATEASRAIRLLGKHLPMTVRGQEVTTSGHSFGHFNVFPLRSGKLLPWQNSSASALFAAARRRRPAVLLQVNHPRMGSIGYFDQMGLDPSTGRASAGYRSDYDLLEVANGDLIGDWSQLQRNINDWFALLNLGKRYVATGNSDAHRLPVQDVGYPRNFVLWQWPLAAEQSPDNPALKPAAVLAALRTGRSYVSTGPLISFFIDDQPLGATLALGARSRQLNARLVVRAAPWVKLDRAVLYANGVATKRWPLRSRAVKRLERSWSLPRPGRDTWYVVMVRGSQPDPTQQRRVLPFALTNPIWVDVDGDGRFAPLKAERERKTP